jgi:hypothetical protein
MPVDSFTFEGATLVHCDHLTLARLVRDGQHGIDGQVHSVVVDAPYSDVVHTGHDSGTAQANRVADWAKRLGDGPRAGGGKRSRMAERAAELKGHRRALGYKPWTGLDVESFVSAWSPLTRDWMLSLTDHELQRSWRAEMMLAGRYAFSPIASTEPGSRVRLDGTGPPQWGVWLVPSRPRSAAWLRLWHAKRKAYRLAPKGSYEVPPGAGDERTARERVPGGKALWTMRAIVGDYTAPGELVCDPCAGSATTLIAAASIGRAALGCEPDRETYEKACERMIKHLRQRSLFRVAVDSHVQMDLPEARLPEVG